MIHADWAITPAGSSFPMGMGGVSLSLSLALSLSLSRYVDLFLSGLLAFRPTQLTWPTLLQV